MIEIRVWMKEGWAEYMESLWIGDYAGVDQFEINMLEEGCRYIEELNDVC